MSKRIDAKEIFEIIQQEPYKKYYTESKRGNKGILFTKKTLSYLEELEDEKEKKKEERKKCLKKSRGSGMIKFVPMQYDSNNSRVQRVPNISQ